MMPVGANLLVDDDLHNEAGELAPAPPVPLGLDLDCWRASLIYGLFARFNAVFRKKL